VQEKKRKNGKKLYLSLCSREWFKIIWILVFLLSVCST
jgi:hypothetical protein